MNINTYEQLTELYLRSGYPKGALQEDLEYYLRNGYVFATPEYFIMGRQIHGGWYIHAAVGVGALEGFLHLMPHYLPYVGWERRGSGKVKWYPTEQLTRKLLKHEISKSTSTNPAASSIQR
jgi:hypothetical protein